MSFVVRSSAEHRGICCDKILLMRISVFVVLLFSMLTCVSGQTAAQKIYETERLFEKKSAEMGMNAAFIEFMTPDGIMFFPEAQNAQTTWKSRPPSPAFLTWNPVLIDVSSNEVLAYSIGNSAYRPKGIDDTTELAGHYLSVWVRRPDGRYRAVLDLGINHQKPGNVPTDWRSPLDSGREMNAKRLSAADSSTGFYQAAAENTKNAFKSYLAEDAILIRDGLEPIVGKRAAIKFLDNEKGVFSFGKRKSFVEAVDLAYVHSSYSISDKTGRETQRGNFVQVWKLRKDRWQIVVDALAPAAKSPNR